MFAACQRGTFNYSSETDEKMKRKTFSLSLTTLCLWAFVLTATTQVAYAQLFGFGRPMANDQSSDVMPKARAAMAEKIKLETKDGQLAFEFPEYEDAEELSQSIIENSYANSHSSSGDLYYCQAESDAAQLVINSGTDQWGQQEKDTQHIKLTDLADATNRVEIKVDSETNQLSLFSMDLQKQKIHLVRQTDERLTLVSIDGESFDYMSDNSLNDLVAQPTFVSALNRLRAAGLGVPKLAARSEIETVVESILNFSAEDRQKFKDAFPNLTSRKFKLRKQAAKDLARKLEDHVVAVSAMLLSDSLPLEMRARFLEAIEACDDEAPVLMIKTIVDGKLVSAPPILVRLLTHQSESDASEESLQKTILQLEMVTGQKFGNDIEKWSSWIQQTKSDKGVGEGAKASATQPKTKPDQANANANANANAKAKAKANAKAKPAVKKKRRRLRKTGREQVEEPLKDLLKLTLNESGALKIDRVHWSKLFDDKSPRALMKEVKQSFAESGLPKSWLTMGGQYNVAGLGYEQILFERIADNVKVRSENYDMYSEMNGHKTKSLNRTMYKSDLRMTMMLHQEGNRWEDVRHKRAYFKFLFEDEAEDLFYLLSEQPKQGFVIFVFWKNGDTVLNLRSGVSGKIQLHHVAAKKKTSLSAESIRDLINQNGDFIEAQILPLLSKLGIAANQVFGKADALRQAE